MITYHHTRFLEEWNEQASRYILEAAHKNAYIALPGGSTPVPLLDYLHKTHREDIADITFIASDERMVELADPASNVGMLHRHLPDSTICIFDEHLAKKLPSAGLDLCILGVGEDGHIASLFPGKQHIALTKTIRTQKPDEPYGRRSLSMRYILKSKRILLLVRGKSKQHIMEELLFGRSVAKNLPVRALLKHPDLVIIHHD